LILGDTGDGRKGMAWAEAQTSLMPVDPVWFTKCIANGLASGEGVISRVRDPIFEKVINKETKALEEKVVDTGVDDKRVLAVVREFSSVLKQFSREGNILSGVLRNGWDGSPLENLTRKNPERATGAHISIIANITEEELIRYLDATEVANGMGNRFLVFAVNRTTFLPNGGNVDSEVREQFQRACRAALRSLKERADKQMLFSADALEAYRELYGEGQRRGVLNFQGEGLFGQMIARGPAHVLRVSLNFAILDCSPIIELPHLAAAVAVWDASARSTFQIFGGMVGASDADTILTALRGKPEGMMRNDIVNLFGRNLPQGRINKALTSLREKGLAGSTTIKTAGRPAELWTATEKPSRPTPDYLGLFCTKEWKAKLERSTKELRKSQRAVANGELGDERLKRGY